MSCRLGSGFITAQFAIAPDAETDPRPCSDAFQRRERASEDYAIRQREKEKLLELKKKLTEQQQHLDRLSKHMFVNPPPIACYAPAWQS